MARKKKADPIPGFDPKWTKKLLAGLSEEGLADFLGDIDKISSPGGSKDEVVELMHQSNKHMSSSRRDMEDSMDLQSAKQEVKNISEPFKAVITCQQAKIEYFLHVIAKNNLK